MTSSICRYRAPGSIGEYGDWIVAVVPVANQVESGYRSAIEAVLEATRDVDEFLAFTEGEDIEDTRHYTLRFSPTGEPLDSQHERSFWDAAVQFPALRPLVARYVEQVSADVFELKGGSEYVPAVVRLDGPRVRLALVINACSA